MAGGNIKPRKKNTYVDEYCGYVTTEKQTITKGRDFIKVNYNPLKQKISLRKR
jgi:hypothetical protein